MPPEGSPPSNIPAQDGIPIPNSAPEPPIPPLDHPGRSQVPDREVILLEIEERIDRKPDRRYLFRLIAILGVFLAPVIFVSAMMAEQDNNWKPVFVGLFSCWIILLAIGLYVDLQPLNRIQRIKTSMWHLGSCVLMLYLIVSITNPTADSLPQWIPLIMDCGLGVSLGVQSIPSNAQEQLWRQLNELVGSFCGGVQVRLQSR